MDLEADSSPTPSHTYSLHAQASSAILLAWLLENIHWQETLRIILTLLKISRNVEKELVKEVMTLRRLWRWQGWQIITSLRGSSRVRQRIKQTGLEVDKQKCSAIFFFYRPLPWVGNYMGEGSLSLIDFT